METTDLVEDNRKPEPGQRPRNRNRRPPLHKQGPGAAPTARSIITNGHALFSRTDGLKLNQAWVRRLRDLIAYFVDQLGGANNVSPAELSVIRTAATIKTELEMMERAFAVKGTGASREDLDLYFRGAAVLRRQLESIGLDRRIIKDSTPSLVDITREAIAKRSTAKEVAE